jgi:hypothetical protein
VRATWKGCGRKCSLSSFTVLSQHLNGGHEENQEKVSHNTRSPARDLNLGPPEYETGVDHDDHPGCLLVSG